MLKDRYPRILIWTLLFCLLQQLEEFAFDFLSGNGDFIDISNFLMPENRPDVSSLSREKLLALVSTSVYNYLWLRDMTLHVFKIHTRNLYVVCSQCVSIL